MEKIISYKFDEEELDIIESYLYFSEKNPCINCTMDKVSCTGCDAKVIYDDTYIKPLEEIFTNADVILDDIYNYKILLDRIEQLKNELESCSDERFMIVEKLPYSIVKLMSEHETDLKGLLDELIS